MSAPTYDEMEAKRQNMIVSFRDVAAAMTRCVAVIEDYVRSTPADAPSATTRLASADIADRKERKKRRKQAKGPRDPNAPKRPPSAYILYQNQVRDAIRTKYPDVPYKEILGQIAEGWRHLSDVQKKPYEESYQHADEIFREADKAYKATLGLPIAEAAAEEDDEDESSESESDSDAVPPTSTVNPAMIRSGGAKAAGTPVSSSIQTPATLALAASEATGSVTKEKKRKNKEEEAQVNAALEPALEKKTPKKKSKKLEGAL